MTREEELEYLEWEARNVDANQAYRDAAAARLRDLLSEGTSPEDDYREREDWYKEGPEDDK